MLSQAKDDTTQYITRAIQNHCHLQNWRIQIKYSYNHINVFDVARIFFVTFRHLLRCKLQLVAPGLFSVYYVIYLHSALQPSGFSMRHGYRHSHSGDSAGGPGVTDGNADT